jgi:ribonuclease HII
MKYPNFNEEKKLWKRGYNFVAGLDEAGRGPLAGPVVAAAVLIDKNAKIGLEGINDSKKLSEKQREEYYNILVNNKDVKWGIGIVSEKIIDKINILQATKLAMEVALVDLNPDYLLLDGNFKINSIVRQMPVVGGDGKVFSIAAASIIAKVTRDRMMQNYHKKFPQYGFAEHKGYGTKAHFANLEKYGPCKIHRKTFYPVSSVQNLSSMA